MSKKYVIEIKPEYEDKFKGLMLLGAKEDNLFVDTIAVEHLEQYTPVDVEKIYDRAYKDGYNKGLKDSKQIGVGAAELREKLEYQKGFEKGKDVRIKGCEGCMYQDTTIEHNPCNLCCNAFLNRWTAKDDKIEVGDVVTINHIKNSDKHSFVVTRVSDQSVWGVNEDGGWNYWAINEVIKTDKHYDIDKILEGIKGDNDK